VNAEVPLASESSSSVGAKQGGWFLAGAIFLIALVFVAYSPALHGSGVWDDDYMLTANRVMTEPGGLWRIFFDVTAVRVYYPVTEAVLWLECRWFGLSDLTGYHAVNMLLQGIDAVLLWRLLARLGLRGAFITSALFAVHPLQVESVAWVTEHKNTLSLLFSLLAAGAYFRSAGVLDVPSQTGRGRSRAYFFALLMYVLALGAKSTATTMAPAVLLITWWKRGRLLREDWVRILPFVLLAGASGALTQWVELHSTGQWKQAWSLSPVQQILVAGRAVCFYLGKLLWPLRISFVYPRWDVRVDQLWQYAFPLGVVTGLLVLWILRKRIGRGPIAAMLFFCGMLAPALGFFHVLYQRYSFVSDHFQYVACIGPIALAGWGLAWVWERSGRFGGLLTGIVIVTLSALTFQSSERFQSDRLVWEQALSLDPDSMLAGLNHASDLIDVGRYDQAERGLLHAAVLHPEVGGIWAGLGRIAEARGNYPVALGFYEKAVGLEADEPRFHFQFANMLMVCGDAQSALVEYQVAARERPDWAQLHDNMGVCYLHLHQQALAVEQFRLAQSLDPNAPLVRRHLAEAAAMKR
jgi:tetratricopeptide (TPR) repeat protein